MRPGPHENPRIDRFIPHQTTSLGGDSTSTPTPGRRSSGKQSVSARPSTQRPPFGFVDALGRVTRRSAAGGGGGSGPSTRRPCKASIKPRVRSPAARCFASSLAERSVSGGGDTESVPTVKEKKRGQKISPGNQA